ncbi:hypothetical protein [Nocardioides lijunqiniae]|uniref:hypothetical protein n=1 Tax=Nocardioides lijunqiniae TaxID=2760832 RepID=UPI0018789FEE|nr:hypothetical protein [Nocardioides lijunqiniae]
MTEKNDYNAKVRGKGLENTGVTEDLAREMFNTLGRSTMAIVRLTHKRQINDDDTGRTVELTIDLLEPSTSAELDEHLRELTRTLHQNRALKADDQQLQIDTPGDLEPTVEGVIAAGRAHIAQTDDPLPEGDDDEPLGDPPVEGATYDHDLKVWIDTDGNTVPSEPAEPTDDLTGDEPPWEYSQPEGTGTADADRPVNDPFAVTTT